MLLSLSHNSTITYLEKIGMRYDEEDMNWRNNNEEFMCLPAVNLHINSVWLTLDCMFNICHVFLLFSSLKVAILYSQWKS